MPRYLRQNVSFEPPAQWNDATVMVFHPPPAPPGSPPSPSVSVTQQRLAEGETIETYFAKSILRMATDLPAVEMVESTTSTVGGRPAQLCRFRYVVRGAPLEQALVMVDTASESARNVTVFSMTSPVARAEESRRLLLEMLKTVRLETRTRTAPPPPLPSPPPPSYVPIDPMPPMIPIPGQRDRSYGRTAR